MCQELRSLRQSIARYAGQFDARSLTPGQAGAAVALCAQIEASAASIKALAAARSAEGTDWQRCGYRSPAEQLADQAGMSPGAAKRALETGRRMADQPEVARAALAGELSLEQAAAVSDGVAANPAKARELIEKAQDSSLPELNEEVAKVKAESSDLEERRRARHAKRSFRRWTDRDGAVQAHLYGHPEDGALLWRMLDPIRRRINILRHQAGTPNETLDALDYDALVTMASIAIGKDGELSLADLVELGLFPQFDAVTKASATAGTTANARAGADSTDPVGSTDPADPVGSTDPADPVGSTDPADPAGSHRPPEPADSAGSHRPPEPADSAGSHRPPEPADSAGSHRPPEPADSAGCKGPPDADPADPAGPSGPSGPSGPAPSPPVKGRRLKKLAGSPLRVMVRVDLDALLRGVPLEGELCEIAGYGPVPVSVIEDLLATENPFIIGLLTKSEALVGVYHHGRHPNAYQRSALDFLHPTCAVQGCSSRAGLQYDHREDFNWTRITAFDLLDRLCGHHHRKKTHEGWALVEGRGKRAFVPPGDPRHPGMGPSRPGAPPGNSPVARKVARNTRRKEQPHE